MLCNNLDPANAEDPDRLVVYGGTGRAARDWDCFDAIVRSLLDLADDETLLVQSGKPVGVLRTHRMAPRVMIANSNLVPRWADWEHFRELERKGLMMYGQMTAGSWIYIGTQGILQGTYETFAALAEKHFGPSLAGRIVVSAGLGGMGGRPAARGHDERRGHDLRGGRRAADRPAARDRLPRRRVPTTSTGPWPWRARRPPRAGRSPSASPETRPTCCPPCSSGGSCPTW